MWMRRRTICRCPQSKVSMAGTVIVREANYSARVANESLKMIGSERATGERIEENERL